MSGARQGVAYLTFASDGSVSGGEIVVPSPSGGYTGRNVGGDIGRNNNTTTLATTNLYGYCPVSGPWGFDSRGRVIGFYQEIVMMSETPPTFFTNGVSFIGPAVPGRRMTLMAQSPMGPVTMHGIPAVTLPDISGSWYGIKRQGKVSAVEFFTLSPVGDLPNTYEVVGTGPGYSYPNGTAMLSSQNKFAMGFDEVISTNYDSTRSVVGPFIRRTLSATMTGIDSPPGGASLTNLVNFRVTRRTSVP